MEKVKPFVKIDKVTQEKEYLVLIYFRDVDDDEYDRGFELIRGRENTYIWIRQHLDEIIITKSLVLVEDANLEELITVYEFMYVMTQKYFQDPDFDINDYLCDEDSFPEDDVEEDSNVIDPQYEEDKNRFQQSIKQNSIDQADLLLGQNE